MRGNYTLMFLSFSSPLSKSKRIEKVVLCKWKEKAGVAIPTYDKIDFKTKVIVREKEDHSWYGLMD